MSSADLLSLDTLSGEIYCISCSATFECVKDCTHVLSAFEDNTDLQIVWDLLPCEVQIPISSTHDIWECVSIEFFHTNMQPHRAIVRMEDEDVCIISPTEGRRVIRTALISKMLGDYKFKPSCKSSSHGPNVERLWKSRVNPASRATAMRIAELWSVYRTGVCLTCNQKINEALNNSIPPREGTSVWNQNNG